MKNSMICITGGTGFVGRHLLNYIADKLSNYEIRLLTRKASLTELPNNVKIIAGDLLEPASLEKFIEPNAIVIHLAYLSGNDPAPLNNQATHNLIQICQQKKPSKLIHISTATVIGNAKDRLVHADSICQPTNTYECSKLAIENLLLKELQETCHLSIIRPTAIFGLGGKNLIKLIEEIKYGSKLINTLKLAIHGYRKMNLVHIDNVVAAIYFLMEHDEHPYGARYIIADDEFPQNNYADVVQLLKQAFSNPKIFDLRLLSILNKLLPLVLRIKQRSNINPFRIYCCQKLMAMGYKKPADFNLSMQQFLNYYASNENTDC